jgi:hypothetical protein
MGSIGLEYFSVSHMRAPREHKIRSHADSISIYILIYD